MSKLHGIGFFRVKIMGPISPPPPPQTPRSKIMSRMEHPYPQRSLVQRVGICLSLERGGFVFGVAGRQETPKRKTTVITSQEVALYVAPVIFIYVFPQKETVLRHFILYNNFYSKNSVWFLCISRDEIYPKIAYTLRDTAILLKYIKSTTRQ